MTVKAIVFDLDGTLADTAADICAALNAALATRGLPRVDVRNARTMIGKGPKILVERALKHIGVYPASNLVQTLTERFVCFYRKQGNKLSALYEGVAECLDALSIRGIPIGVCSNKPQEFCVTLLQDLGVADRLSAIQGSDATLPKKPDPAMLNHALRRLNVEPGQALYVGDSKTDVTTARAAGVRVTLVNYGYSDVPVDELGADAVISSLEQLAAGLPPPRSAKP